MPDLTIETALVCASALSWSTTVTGSKGFGYVVTWGEVPELHGLGWTCTCPAFQYGHGKPYKHIEQVKGDRCSWNAHLEPTLQPAWSDERGEPCCPECGGPVVPVQVGV
jgi:hypothetical protein